MKKHMTQEVNEPKPAYVEVHYAAKQIRELLFTMSMCLSEEECKGMNRAKELIARYVETALRTDGMKEG